MSRLVYFLLCGFFLMLSLVGFAQSADGLDGRAFEPEGKFFSVRLPSGWEKSEMDQMKDYQQYSLKVYAPGFEGLGYLMIGIDYYAEPYRSPERYIFDLQHPGLGNASDVRGDQMQVQVYGKKAVALTLETVRSLILFEGTVPCKQRYVVYPAETGFFVFSLDAPVAQFQKYLPSFDALLSSFKPLVAGNAAIAQNMAQEASLDEVTSEDYAVYDAFIQTEELKGELPPYFDDALRESSVLDVTSLREEWMKKVPSQVVKDFGAGAAELFTDLQKNNAKEYLIKDKIFASDSRILPQRSIRLGRMNPENTIVGSSSFLAFARVGFNRSKTLALLYVGHAGNPITSYFVLLEKKENRWVIKNVSMDRMLIQ